MFESIQELSTIVIIGCVGFYLATVLFIYEFAKKHRARAEALEEQLGDANAQIAMLKSHGADLVQKVGWRRQKLMNLPEFRLFQQLERLVAQGSKGHRVFTQVSCGEFLEVAYRADLKDIARNATHCLNRKRVDFLLIDRSGKPIAAIEYQGEGHYQGNAHDRDHAKRVACHAAGIRFVEVAASGLTNGQKADLLDLIGCKPKSAIAAE
jgi:hypothetical protein